MAQLSTLDARARWADLSSDDDEPMEEGPHVLPPRARAVCNVVLSETIWLAEAQRLFRLVVLDKLASTPFAEAASALERVCPVAGSYLRWLMIQAGRGCVAYVQYAMQLMHLPRGWLWCVILTDNVTLWFVS